MITSLDNSKIKDLAKLNTSKYRFLNEMFLVEGEHLVNEAKALNIIYEIYTTDENLDGILISDSVMKKLCNTSTPVKQIAICKLIKKENLSDKILLIDKIQDPGNLGSLMRSAVAFGFNSLVISEDSVDIYNSKVIRSSQGAIFKLNFIFSDIKQFILLHPEYKIYGTDVINGISSNQIKPYNKIGIILGNESKGITDEIKSLNLENIYIKMENTESLNVAIAGSIIMYEVSKI